MASLNKCEFIGNVGRDPEVRNTASGNKVANFSIACTDKYKDRNGQQQEVTEWIDVVVWNKLAEVVEKYVRKGKQVYIEAVKQSESYEDANGVKRYKTFFKAKTLLMLGNKTNTQSNGYQNNGQDYNDAPVPQYEDNTPF